MEQRRDWGREQPDARDAGEDRRGVGRRTGGSASTGGAWEEADAIAFAVTLPHWLRRVSLRRVSSSRQAPTSASAQTARSRRSQLQQLHRSRANLYSRPASTTVARPTGLTRTGIRPPAR